MSVHRFSSDTGGIEPGLFGSAMESYRSDADQLHSPLSLYDVNSRDIALARTMADEMINTSGAEIKIFARTENADYDSVWDEDPDPTYWRSESIKAFFKPEPIQTELTKWGADTKNTTEVVFSHMQLYALLNDRMLRTGDVLQLPYNAAMINPKNFRILNGSPSGNYRYVWLYYTCQVETLTADVAVRPEEDMLVVDEPFTGYRESI